LEQHVWLLLATLHLLQPTRQLLWRLGTRARIARFAILQLMLKKQVQSTGSGPSKSGTFQNTAGPDGAKSVGS